MLLVAIILVLLLVSVVLSYISLKNDVKKHKHVEEVEKKLAKGKVLFYSPSSDSSK